ncbi:hypothetical protein K435DRAFT_44087 [Dendrothele bispora CBS 962.96]|uniref:Uncharacterized protein n=1 Tax=Dendrothele bispora (strain CBS 962.96) TaxID=1314807 RepID=A0A4S8MSH0_DENBC|nr:hypothetical protein K435DRAFT_44087 [Dendrothele bispora CBS 962.96]
MTIPNGSSKSGSNPSAGSNNHTQSLIPLNQSDSNLYTRLLLPKGHGYPLWIPETDTNLPVEYRRYGTRIGDVGIVTDDGGFDYLFNICLPANDPVNKGRVPRDFEPLDTSLDIRNNPTRFKPGADISSSFIKKSRTGETQESSTYTFTPSREEGAVLVLPEGGSRSDLRNQGEFRRYAAQNATSWYQFVNATLGWDISNGSMYLVTGCDKTSSWGNAVISNLSGAGGDVTMEFGPKPSSTSNNNNGASDEGRGQFIWLKDGPAASVRYGPDEAEADAGRQANQCIFIRGFRVCVSPAIFADSFRKSNAEDVSSAHVVRKPQAYHPSAVVNEFIFTKTSGIDVVLAHDEQWPSLMNENDTIIPEDEELIRRTFTKFNLVIENGVYYNLCASISL